MSNIGEGQVGIRNIAEEQINPATSEKQGQYLDSETGLWTDRKGMNGAQASISYETMIGRGLIPGHSKFWSIGERIGATNHVDGNDVCQATAIESPIPTQPTGDLMTIVSTSASDGVAGTGVQSVDVHYIDVNGNAQEIIVTMNGITPVDIPLTYMRFVQILHTESTGTGKKAVGTITIYKTGSPTIIYNQINPGGNMSLNSSRMVPLGKIFYMKTSKVSAADNTAVSIRLRATSTHEDVLIPSYFFLFKDTDVLQNAALMKVFDPPLEFPALSIIKITAYSTTNGASISADYRGYTE